MRNQRGLSLIELMILIVIMGILLTIGMITFSSFLKRSRLTSHINGLASAIKMSRSAAMNQGQRAVVVVVNRNQSHQDLDEDGEFEHYLTFLDPEGDNICGVNDTVLDSHDWDTVDIVENTLPHPYPGPGDARCFFFLPQGTAPGLGDTDSVIEIRYEGYDPEYRLNIISYLGAVEVERVK